MSTGRTPAAPAGWRVEIDRSACDGTGLCVGRAPGYFEIDATRRSRLRPDRVPPEGYGPDEFPAGDEAVVDAAECCPMEAIRVTDPATGRLLHPQD